MQRKYEVAAYYFPNFHCDPKVEQWHGKGWTEWELVKNATPRFVGHMQPKVPLWGYEDEADPVVMEKKISAAAGHGISAFIFDWYWHQEGPFLERCLDEGYLNAANNSDVKFAIMWANHDWLEIHPATRYQPYPTRLTGAVSEQIFIDATEHIIERYFTHPSYWKLDGKFYFSIYEMMSLVKGLGGLSNTKRVLEDFRAKIRARGLGELHLNAVVWGIETLPTENTLIDADKVIEYLGIDSVTSYVWVHHITPGHFPDCPYNEIRECAKAEHARLSSQHALPYIPNVTVGWDSSPRTVQTDCFDDIGYPWFPVYTDNSPAEFEKALQDVKNFMDTEKSVFPVCTINAWNEWTEGSYLEPDTVNGFSYLAAVKKVFS
ncbi:glycosyl transferase family WbsX [Buttiauxella sp. JUb87]|uniref:glycosyltransferase WbsX family protein n=1 Tax=Buttiauxella sp. JUb87 TaxID=2485129 RepID=UPI00105BF8F4|nr:glycoside hydrolase family 99-like domain-containing protein [Buttiauxella sp. JUb87]TDN51778.1 glycosyl transferase family WbsX [Buttiauxella sp. JUb87]